MARRSKLAGKIWKSESIQRVIQVRYSKRMCLVCLQRTTLEDVATRRASVQEDIYIYQSRYSDDVPFFVKKTRTHTSRCDYSVDNAHGTNAVVEQDSTVLSTARCSTHTDDGNISYR